MEDRKTQRLNEKHRQRPSEKETKIKKVRDKRKNNGQW